MNSTIKAHWVEGLRSGKYKQGRRRLRTGNEFNCFCALGVLCDIVNPALWRLSGGWYAFGLTTPHSSYYSLPDNLATTIGLKSEDQTLVTILNDLEGKSFDEIADWIEDNL